MPINATRFKHYFSELSNIGKEADGGITRLALTDEDKQVRDHFIKLMQTHGLSVRVDDLGNVYGRLEGKNPSHPPIVIGSHLDTVKSGGLYDGAVGVAAGLEILIALKEEGWEPEVPIEVVSFTNEEGARFPNPMLASGTLAKHIPEDKMMNMKDSDGFILKEELERIGYKGDKAARLEKVKMYAEIHIEQGPVLERKQKQVGIIQGIQGLSWHKLIFKGKSDHAASTPYDDRNDALRSAVHTMEKLYEAKEHGKTSGSFTIGKLEVTPNISNVIAREVIAYLDIRNPDEDQLQKDIDTYQSIIQERNHPNNVEIHDLAYQSPVEFSPRLTAELEKLCDKHGVPSEKMYSGAGHDAIHMPSLGETVMLFIPSTDGVSHSKEEHSDWADIQKSTELLFDLVKKESAFTDQEITNKEATS